MSSNFKVLVVDDDSDVLDLIVATLEDAGLQSFKASSAEEAWEIIQKQSEQISFVISDYHMPGMTGMELRRKMMDDYFDIPFIINSGNIMPEVYRDALELKVEKI